MPNIELKSTKYSLAEKLRVAAASQGKSLFPDAWIAPSAWSSGLAVREGEVRSNGGNWYVSLGNGTTGVTAPTHTANQTPSDGAVPWSHLGYGLTSNDARAPTLTNTGSASTPSGTTAMDVWANRALFTLRGCYATQYVTSRMTLNAFSKKAGTVQGGGSVAFWSDAPLIGFEANSGTRGIVIYVDDRPVQWSPIGAGLAGTYWSTLSHADGRRPRKYEVFMPPSANNFMRISIGSNDQVWPDKPAVPLRGVFVGDSYIDLAGTNYGPFIGGNNLASLLGRAIGIPDMWAYGTGGTGLLNPGASSFYTYRERIPELLTLSPDVIFVYGSSNDSSYTSGQISTEAGLFLDTLRASTSAPLFWFGPIPTAVPNLSVVDAAIASAIAARPNQNIFYKSPSTDNPAWPVAGQYINNGDNVHLIDKGNRQAAQLMANSYVREMLPLVA